MKQLSSLSKFSFSRIFSILAEISYLLIIFLVPLWFAFVFPTFNMFELSKLLLFRFLISFFTIFTLLYLLFQGRLKRIHKTLRKGAYSTIIKLFWPPLLLILILGVLTPFSSNSLQSFWGSYARQQGLLSYLLYFSWAVLLFFYLIAKFISEGKELYNRKIKNIIISILASSTLVAIYGILQILNIDIFTWPEAPYLTGRTLSSFGQPNFLASFLLFTIPLSAYYFFKSKKIWSKFIYAWVLGLQILCLYFTGSRAAILALIAILGIFIFKTIFFGKVKTKHKIVLGISLFGFALISLISINILIPGRMSSALDMKAGSSAARVNFFQSAASSILEKPLIGHGLESGSDVFIKYYERDWALHGQVATSADRAHNLILDILLTSGFIGLLVFSLWYYSYFKIVFSQAKESENYKLSKALGFGALAYIFSLFFGFTIIVGEVYFWLFFALLASFVFVEKNGHLHLAYRAEDFVFSDREKYIWGAIVIFPILASCLFINNTYKTLKSDYYLSQMDLAINSSQRVRAAGLRQLIESIDANPTLIQKANYHLAASFAKYCSYDAYVDASEEVVIKRELEELALKLDDRDYLNIFTKANIYTCLEKPDLAKKYYDKIIELSPSWPASYLELGSHFAKIDNIPEAIKYFKLVEINLPDTNSPLINEIHRKGVYNYKHTMYKSLAEAYMRQGDYIASEKFFQLAYHSFPSDYSLLKKIADCHYLMGDKKLALRYNLHGLALNPDDYTWPLIVSILYDELGELDKAASYKQMASDIAPEHVLGDLN